MADEKSPVDQLLDLFLFAPLGFVCGSRELYPKLAEEGRAQLAARIQVARMIGQFAVRKGQQEAAKAMDRHRAATPSAPDSTSGPDTTADNVVALHHELADMDDITEADLAIPSYGTLAASQVVSRLEGLAPVELETVRRYEVAHRGRKTVLGKIANLQSQG